MNILTLSRIAAVPLLGVVLSALPASLRAQGDGTDGPPNVLVIQREYLKPGKAGSTHEKTERAFVEAMSAANWPSHYFAMDSLSGPPRSLFFSGYPSFQAWEKDSRDMRKNAALSAKIDQASLADGEVLSNYDQSVFALRKDMSLNMGNLNKKRYMEITRFDILPGHDQEWEDVGRLYTEGFKKGVPDGGWVMYQMIYGNTGGGVFLVLHPLTSLEEADKGMGDFKKVTEALGPESMKKMNQMYAASVKDTQSNVFEINPRISYPPDAWVKAEPDFWQGKPKSK